MHIRILIKTRWGGVFPFEAMWHADLDCRNMLVYGALDSRVG